MKSLPIVETKEFTLNKILPNPFRNIDEYPIIPEKVSALIESYQSTGVWPVFVGRSVEGGKVEIAFGHHRLEAARQAKIRAIPVHVIHADDDAMFKMMANENLEEWETSTKVLLQTVRTLVEQFADGRLHLPSVKWPNGAKTLMVRLAPRFTPTRVSDSQRCESENAYTESTLVSYLGSGWTERKVQSILNLLATDETGEVPLSDLPDAPYSTSEQIIAGARAVERSSLQQATVAGLNKAAAKRQARKSKHDFLSEVKKSDENSRRSGGGPIAYKEVGRIRAQVIDKSKRTALPDISEKATEVTADLQRLLVGTDKLTEALRQLAENYQHLTEIDAKNLNEALLGLSERARKWAHKFQFAAGGEKRALTA